VPVAANDTLTVAEDSGTTAGDLGANDTDLGDGGIVWALATGATNGVAVVNADGTYTYTPNADYNGPDSFTYTVTDADGDVDTGTVNITVTPVNDVPVAADDTLTVSVNSSPVAGNLAANDTDLGDGGIVWALATGATNGVAVVNADGTYTYTPNADYNGPDSFTYTVTDADGDVSTATIMVSVVNDVIDGALLAAIDSLGEPASQASGGSLYQETSVGMGNSGSVLTTSGVTELGNMAALSAHSGTNDDGTYLGFVTQDGFYPGNQDDGSVDYGSTGNADAWVKYRHRAIDWLLSSAYAGDGTDGSDKQDIIVGDALGLYVFGTDLLGDFDFTDSHQGEEAPLLDGFQFASIALSVGAISWAIRAGGLLTSLLVGLPIWREFDPLPVVAEDEDEKQKVREDDDNASD
ncbi:MAG: tandem-95 repeat protein, partial [Gammaproteobacteria bacterium]|nr:tandem-95 repeat protein [Gammaproteobacteria bacterium]